MVFPRDLPVSQRSDDEPWGIAKVLIGVEELSITDVCKAVPLLIRPSVPELRQPNERLGIVHLEHIHKHLHGKARNARHTEPKHQKGDCNEVVTGGGLALTEKAGVVGKVISPSPISTG